MSATVAIIQIANHNDKKRIAEVIESETTSLSSANETRSIWFWRGFCNSNYRDYMTEDI